MSEVQVRTTGSSFRTNTSSNSSIERSPEGIPVDRKAAHLKLRPVKAIATAVSYRLSAPLSKDQRAIRKDVHWTRHFRTYVSCRSGSVCIPSRETSRLHQLYVGPRLESNLCDLLRIAKCSSREMQSTNTSWKCLELSCVDVQAARCHWTTVSKE